MNKIYSFQYLFEPRSVAIVGASRHPEKIGHKILNNIVSGGYRGKIYPVNPENGEILGLKTYRKISEIKEEIDFAVICIPAKFVYEAVKDCVAKKIKFVSIISSGFSEIGNIKEEEEIILLAKENGTRILGPNVFGLYSAKASLNATFGPQEILPGKVAILTQSGALGLALIGKTAAENLGISTIVSLGNKADLNSADLLEYFAKDQNTKVIFLYLESIKNGRKLTEAVKKTILSKPVIIVKSGRSEKGKTAAASHTGSLAADDRVFNNLLGQAGALRAESIKEALDWCKFISLTPKPKGNNTVIVTNGGGLGVLATDACEKYGVKLFDNQTVLEEIFAALVPYFGSFKNPIDLTGQAAPESYRQVLRAALGSQEIHSVIAIYCETAVLETDKLLPIILENYQKFLAAKKPLILSFFGGIKTEKIAEELKKEKIPFFAEIYDAVSALAALQSYTKYLNAKEKPYPLSNFNPQAIEKIIAEALKNNRQFLLADESQRLAKIIYLPTLKSFIATSSKEAITFAEKIGFPVVMKVISPQIIHKTEAGGIFLNLNDSRQVNLAYRKIRENCRKYKPQAQITGVKIEEMLKPGTEVIIGAKKDPNFGPIILFGSGGIYVEVLQDISCRSFPASREDIIAMIKETKVYSLLEGTRNQKPKDLQKIIDIIIKLGTLVEKCPSIAEIEINPLIIYETEAKAADLRIILATADHPVSA